MKFTKIICLAMVALLSVGLLVSCGGNGAANYTKDNEEFFIGGTGPLTGSASSYGISVKQGAELAIEEINAAGGLDGINFKFDIKDDQAAADKASTAYDQLFEDGMQDSIGSVT